MNQHPTEGAVRICQRDGVGLVPSGAQRRRLPNQTPGEKASLQPKAIASWT